MKPWMICLLLAVAPALATAHQSSNSFMHLSMDAADHVAGSIELAFRDLDYIFQLDVDRDGRITWAEAVSRVDAVRQYLLERLRFYSGDVSCPLMVAEPLATRHQGGGYEVFHFVVNCAGPPATWRVDYQLLFDSDSQHRGLFQISDSGGARVGIFSPDHTGETFAPDVLLDRSEAFVRGVQDGVWHIWEGYDHVLFLLTLLIPAVLSYRGQTWHGVPSFSGTLINVAKVVTAFTAAHSITLGLAAFSIVAIPTRVVEPAIAATVVAAALNNIYPLWGEQRWTAAFACGLIHGFGFASVLGALGQPGSSTLATLLSFNLGIELGQMAIVAAFVPLAFWFRNQRIYYTVVLQYGSLSIAAVAGIWFVERLLDFRIAGI